MMMRITAAALLSLAVCAARSRAGESEAPSAKISDNGRSHWAFQPVKRPAVPSVAEHAQNAIDAFIVPRLPERGLILSQPASKRTLIRRVTFDLIGLPPTPAEIDAFEQDTSADDYEKLLNRLLASPHYGERWGRHWLDLARFAETDGYEHDAVRPNAWRYRDYVIQSVGGSISPKLQ